MASDVDPAAELPLPELSPLLDDIEQAIIVQDASGRIQLLNRAARQLFPDLTTGDEFRHGGQSFVITSGGRQISAALRQLTDGWQAWVCRETGPPCTDPQDFLVRASRALATGMSHESAAATLVTLAVPTVGEQAAVLLPAPRARVAWWRAGQGAQRPAQGLLRAPSPAGAPVLASALGGTSPDTVTLPLSERAALAAVLGPHATTRGPIVVAPLRGPERTEGVLIVVRPCALELLTRLAEVAGPTIAASRRRREQAGALARLQAPLLPPPPGALPELPGVQLGVAYRAAGELAVGGDFYLVRPASEELTLLALGDVCGKGAEALAESGRVQYSLGALMIIERDPVRLLYLLNEALLAAGRTVFTTLVLGALQPAAQGCALTLSTGGHPAPLLLRVDGRVEEVGVPGTVVGILPDARFGKTSIGLRPGETCLLYSDGVTEASRRTPQGQEQFGSARLASCLRACTGMTAQALASCVERTVREWLGRNEADDLAVLAIRAVERNG